MIQDWLAQIRGALFPFARALWTLAVLLRGCFTSAHLLATLPLSLAGAFLALLLGGAELGLPALSGLMILIGARAPVSG